MLRLVQSERGEGEHVSSVSEEIDTILTAEIRDMVKNTIFHSKYALKGMAVEKVIEALQKKALRIMVLQEDSQLPENSDIVLSVFQWVTDKLQDASKRLWYIDLRLIEDSGERGSLEDFNGNEVFCYNSADFIGKNPYRGKRYQEILALLLKEYGSGSPQVAKVERLKEIINSLRTQNLTEKEERDLGQELSILEFALGNAYNPAVQALNKEIPRRCFAVPVEPRPVKLRLVSPPIVPQKTPPPEGK